VHPSTPGGPIPTPAGEGGRVRAQQAQRSPIRWLSFRERVVLSMWFVPAISDPTTAVQAIDRITDLLTTIAQFRRRTFAAEAAPASAYLEPASVPDRLGFG
jgi:hypothetical protein